MDRLRELLNQMWAWWQGLAPELRYNIIGGVTAGVVLGFLAFLWRGFRHRLWLLLPSEWLKPKETSPMVISKEEADRQRKPFLDEVESQWIDGVLKRSLYHEVLLALNLQDRGDVILPPLHWNIQLPETEPKSLPTTTSILDIFDESKGRLLILGEPGSGKTITLLTLARHLIDRARQDEDAPLPVVLTLVSWAREQKSMEAWIVDELEKKYGVPRPLGTYWVKRREMVLLLDGLDEVEESARPQCIEAINAYTHALGSQVAVCSRKAEYEAVAGGHKLEVNIAVQIQPLTAEQVFDYLSRLGPEAAPVRSALEEDRDLLSLVRVPLMLHVILLAYQGEQVERMGSGLAVEEKRKRIFDRYIERVFLKHGSAEHLWPPRQVLQWLGWMARGLLTHNEMEFRLENLQPDWLSEKERALYRRLLTGELTVGGGLVFGLVFGLIVGLIGGLVFGLSGGLVFGLSGGLIIGLTVSTQSTIKPVTGMHLNITFSQIIRSIAVHLTITLIPGLFFGLSGGLIVGLVFGLGGGLVDVLVVRSSGGLSGGLIDVLVFRLGGGLSGDLIDVLGVGLVFGLVFGLVVGLGAGLSVGLGEFLRPTYEIHPSKPNEPIWSSGKYALVGGLVFGLVFGLVYGLVFGLVFGLISGLAFGLIFGLKYGGYAFLQHWALRFALWRYGHTPPPWRCVEFLDYAVKRILLRRVGGGWIFIHRMLMEHIAGLDDRFMTSLDEEWRKMLEAT